MSQDITPSSEGTKQFIEQISALTNLSTEEKSHLLQMSTDINLVNILKEKINSKQEELFFTGWRNRYLATIHNKPSQMLLEDLNLVMRGYPPEYDMMKPRYIVGVES